MPPPGPVVHDGPMIMGGEQGGEWYGYGQHPPPPSGRGFPPPSFGGEPFRGGMRGRGGRGRGRGRGGPFHRFRNENGKLKPS